MATFDQTVTLGGRGISVKEAPWAGTNALPADTVAPGADWASTWVELGLTSDGVEFDVQTQRAELMADQLVDPILRPIQSRSFHVKSNLLEITPLHLKAAVGQGSISSVAPSTGVPGHDDLDITGLPTDTYYSAGFEMVNPNTAGESIRGVLWKGLPMAQVTAKFTWNAPAQIAADWAGVPDTGTTGTPISPARLIAFRHQLAGT